MNKVAIIGLGNMGAAINEILKKDFEIIGCVKGDDLRLKLAPAEVVIVGVKPQDFEALAQQMKADNVEVEGKIFISIMAGICLEGLERNLGTKKVVRTLPNLPLKIAKGVTPWRANDSLNKQEKQLVQNILAKFGDALEVGDEELIATISVVSGCGPAYFAFITEQLEKFLVNAGINSKQAQKIALDTFIGSAYLLESEGIDAKTLRARITSKGGITEAAITHMENHGLDEIFIEGLNKALEKTFTFKQK